MTEDIAEQSIVPQAESDSLRTPAPEGMEKIHAEPYAPVAERAGQTLARAREKQDMSVADVARALRLGVKQIEALEADDYASLPGRTFVRGFIRNYARLVQLDPDQLAASAFGSEPEATSRHIQAPSQQISFSEHHARPWIKWLAVIFVVVALVSWSVLEWLGPEQGKTRVTVSKTASSSTSDLAAQDVETPSAGPAPAQEALAPVQPAETPAVPVPAPARTEPPAISASPTSPAQASLGLAFSGPAWVEVRDKNGKKIHSQNNLAGTQQTVQGEPPLSLVIGSAPNVKLTYKGQPVDLNAHTKADVARLTLE